MATGVGVQTGWTRGHPVALHSEFQLRQKEVATSWPYHIFVKRGI